MTKTLLSILIALVFVFGAAGVTVAAAQQSQPGEPLYLVKTWSTQMFRQLDKTQVSEQTIQTQSRIHEQEMTQPQILEQAEHTIQTQSGIHEIEILQTPQSPATLDVCDQSGTNGQCGSHLDTDADHVNGHSHQDHRDDGANHQNDRTDHQNGGSNHENDGSEHEENEH